MTLRLGARANIRGFLVVLALLASCRKTYTVDVTAVNALVPAKYKYKLTFESRDLTCGFHRHVTYTLPVPKGWRADRVGGAHPVDTIVNGDSGISVSSSCDAAVCLPEDWNARIDRELRDAYMIVLRDERGDHRRTVVTTPGLVPADVIEISAYWWVPGASEYHVCVATLRPGVKDAPEAFQKACESVVVHDHPDEFPSCERDSFDPNCRWGGTGGTDDASASFPVPTGLRSL